jgi:DNA invertase Pin-like site-specific DNA recombinase
MSERRHARQRRPNARARGWASTSEYAVARGLPRSTVKRWCQRGSVPDRTGALLPVEGGDGRDYRIPLAAL